MKKKKIHIGSFLLPQKRPPEGTKLLLFAAGIYLLLLIWSIVFKFSAVSQINTNSSKPIITCILHGLCFFDFFLETNPWRLIRGLLIALLNVLLFMPWGIYASFFYKKKRAVALACAFSLLVECFQLFARFGVFSFEDVALNTFGAFLGVLVFEKHIDRISESTTQKINRWTVCIGTPFTILAYVNVIVAMALHFS